MSYAVPLVSSAPDEHRVQFVNPNARCPVCGVGVYFYRSENGGSVYFDSLGWPWPKHPCMDRGETRSVIAGVAGAATKVPTRPPPEAAPGDWVPFEIITVMHGDGRTILVGRPDQHVASVGIGISKVVLTTRDMPAFIRAKPERRGIIELTTLNDLEPLEIDAFLDCTELDEVTAWERAVAGCHGDENAVGHRMSFGRARKYTIHPGEFTRANWLGAHHWFSRAARGGHPSALNNLASPKMMDGCGIDEAIAGDLRQTLYSCAKELEQSSASGELRHQVAMQEARQLVVRYAGLVTR
ncbi:hypothetical protein [Brevundimonas sp. SGAir0440]|uniref:hypothetical protein n=1 Tax=Brevundimonas sp. SGAir0440 TaxID=2579977 RepID=UPI0010CCF81F|nr:hypothetical protein [Brevundimonas sp. SGAir0440]QCQ97762.1 hypothetical protein E7T10_03295 [Brevundimonas sp. SGAir0440]